MNIDGINTLFFLAEHPVRDSAIGHYFKESYLVGANCIRRHEGVGANCIRRHDYKMKRLQDAYGIRRHEWVGANCIRRHDYTMKRLQDAYGIRRGLRGRETEIVG